MRLKKIKIANYKNIHSLQKEFDGNVFIVKGDNEEGKTTFCRSFLKLITKVDKPEVPVTIGEANGSIEGVFTDADGNKYTVILEFSNDKETIRMITPQGISTTKVGDIRGLFNYNYVDVDEFISWSSTAEGRRKQRDIVLGLLKCDCQEKFNTLEIHEKELYSKRTDANRERDFYKKNYEGSIISDQDKLNIKSYESIEENYLRIKEKYDNSASAKASYELVEQDINFKRTEIETLLETNKNLAISTKITENTLLREIEDLKQQIKHKEEAIKKAVMDSKITIDKNLETVTLKNKEVEAGTTELAKLEKINIDDLKTNLEVAEKEFDKAKDSLKAKQTMDANFKTYEEKLKVAENYSSQIEDTRKEKTRIINEANLPIPGLSIDEDGIRLNELPFTKEQLSTSQIMTTVFKIVAALNQETPIFYLGRAESLGKAKLDDIVKIAVENNYQVFLDKVESGEELKIEIYESVK